MLVDYLRELQKIVDQLKLEAPDNVFSHYLDFVSNYTAAKIMELNYRIYEINPAKISLEELSQLSEAQQGFLLAAKAALDDMVQLVGYFEDRGVSHIKGLEFSLGQEVSGKFPTSNFEELKDHVVSLLAK